MFAHYFKAASLAYHVQNMFCVRFMNTSVNSARTSLEFGRTPTQENITDHIIFNTTQHIGENADMFYSTCLQENKIKYQIQKI